MRHFTKRFVSIDLTPARNGIVHLEKTRTSRAFLDCSGNCIEFEGDNVRYFEIYFKPNGTKHKKSKISLIFPDWDVVGALIQANRYLNDNEPWLAIDYWTERRF